MKAAVYYGKCNMRVDNIDIPEPKPNEVRIRVAYCGVCGTDVHIFHGDGGSFEVAPPLVPGHEFSGIVDKVGDEITNLKAGDRVCCDPNIMCGKCYYCQNGMEHFCENNVGIGTTANGGFAEYVIVPDSHVYKIPTGLSLIQAAMAEPISCCLHGIDLSKIKLGDSVLIVGGGTIGNIMVQLAKKAGAAIVILSEPVGEKRELALKLGADFVYDPTNDNLSKEIHKITKNLNIVIECAGNSKAQEEAIHFAGKAATVMFFGLSAPEDTIRVYPDEIFKKELVITSSFINPYTFSRAVNILSGNALDVTSIITKVAPIEELPNILANPEARQKGKVIVKMFDAE